jgi:hypothetical protein
MAESWIKLHTDILHDPKILRLHPYGRLAWVGLLLLARNGRPAGTWSVSGPQPGAIASDLCIALSLRSVAYRSVRNSVRIWIESRMVSVSRGSRAMLIVTHWRDRQGDLRPSASPEKTRARQRVRRMSRGVTRCHAVSRQRRGEESRSETATTTPLPPKGGRARKWREPRLRTATAPAASTPSASEIAAVDVQAARAKASRHEPLTQAEAIALNQQRPAGKREAS